MRKKLLIVDDSIFIWEEMKRLLADTDFDIIGCAKDGERAMVLFDELQPDVVTMDIILPGMDGIAVAQLLLEKNPAAKIVIVSSLAYDDMIQEAKDAGAEYFVFKPFDKQQILTVLEKACANL